MEQEIKTMSRETKARSRKKGQKVLAVSAVAAVVGVGGLATLAAWNDSEWIFAGNGAGGPGLGTSSFNVQQNTTVPLAEEGWTDAESNPGGEVVFTPGALNLTPGDSVYAPVALQTESGSIAGDLTLQNPVQANGMASDAGLWGTLTYSVRAAETSTACSADTWDAFGAEIVTDEAFGSLDTSDTPTDRPQQNLDADSGNTQYYCFQVTLPEDTTPEDTADVDALQGQTAAPAWEFIAESVDGATAEDDA